MPTTTVTDDELAELVNNTAEAASAYLNGDLDTYFRLIKHAKDDYTLMSPFGGEPIHGYDDSAESRKVTSEFFQGGEAKLDLIKSYVSPEMVVLVIVERQHGKVGDLPPQDWSLRVTLVYRRVDDYWRLVHRHADPLVHPIGMDRLALLARGED